MKNVNDRFLILSIILFLLALFAVRASASNFVYIRGFILLRPFL